MKKYESIKKRILDGGLEVLLDEDFIENFEMPQHDNIRGGDYYK